MSGRFSWWAAYEVLLEPVIGVRVRVEGRHLHVSRSLIETDRFHERPVGLEAQRRQTELARLGFELGEDSPTEPEAAHRASNPHALDRPDAGRDRLHRPAGNRLTVDDHDEKGAPRWGQLG